MPHCSIYKVLAPLALWATIFRGPAGAAEPTSRPAEIQQFPVLQPITLQLSQKNPQDLLAELTRQSGIKTRVIPANLWQTRPAQLCDIDVKGVSYWRAMQEICRVGGLQVGGWEQEVVINNGGGHFGLTGDGPVSDQGPVMTMAQRIHRSHTADLQTGDIRRNCSLNLLLYVDPRARLVAWKQICVTVARDEKGNDLGTGTSNNAYADRYNQGSTWQINQTIGLTPLTRTGGTVAELKGYLPAVVVLKAQTIEIPDPLTRKQFKQDVGPWSVEVTETKDKRPSQTPKAYQVDIVMQQREKNNPPPNFDVGRLVQLFDAKGQCLMRQRWEGSNTTTGGRSQASLIYMQQTFGGEQIGPPVKLLIEVPLEMKEMQLPFEFRNLALP